MADVIAIVVALADNSGRLAFKVRDAWTISRLIGVGERGVTPRQQPAPRWSEHVSSLSSAGLDIEAIIETHGGPFNGHHGRYVLRTTLAVIKREVAP